MQEYCTRGTRRDATKALLKLLSNHLSLRKRRKEKQQRRRAKQLNSNQSKQSRENRFIIKANKMAYRHRYLPHDPRLETGDSNAGTTKEIKPEQSSFKVPEHMINGKVFYIIPYLTIKP